MKIVAFLYVFLFGCLFKMSANQTLANTQQQQPKNCVKHPLLIKPRVIADKSIKPIMTDKIVKTNSPTKSVNSIPHFSVFNFINFFYSKDTLDNLHVM